MSDVAEILPSSSGTFELALADGMSDTLPIPYGQIIDPYSAPVEWLPWLAANCSVDLWFDDWSTAKKREAIAQAAGRSIVFDGEIAALKTTRSGVVQYLSQVDGVLMDTVSYPAFAFCDDAFCEYSVVDHPPFLATHLVKVETNEVHGSFVEGAFADGSFAGLINTIPYDRCLMAIRVAKGLDTEVRVDFQNARVITAGDGILAGDGFKAGQYIARTKL